MDKWTTTDRDPADMEDDAGISGIASSGAEAAEGQRRRQAAQRMAQAPDPQVDPSTWATEMPRELLMLRMGEPQIDQRVPADMPPNAVADATGWHVPRGKQLSVGTPTIEQAPDFMYDPVQHQMVSTQGGSQTPFSVSQSGPPTIEPAYLADMIKASQAQPSPGSAASFVQAQRGVASPSAAMASSPRPRTRLAAARRMTGAMP